jgi:HEAT repeat protein
VDLTGGAPSPLRIAKNVSERNAKMKSHSKVCVAGLAVGLLASALAGPQPASAAGDDRVAQALAVVQVWKYGQDAAPLQWLHGEVVKAGRTPAERGKMEQRLIAALGAAKTRGGKAFLCRQLTFVGSQGSVPALAALLADEEASHMARYALQRIPGEAAAQALRKALQTVDETLKIGMVYSLGQRRDKQAVALIARQLASRNDSLVVASLVALSRIDSDEAVAAVARARGTVGAKLKPAATAAYLDCARRLADAGRKADAAAIYQKLFAAGEPTMCRIAALNGLAATATGGRAMRLAIAALRDRDPKVRQVAVPALRDVPGTAATKAIADEVPRQQPAVQAQLILLLGDRGDKAGLPAVTRAAGSTEETVRIAALEALGKLGDASSVGLLAGKAAAGSRSEQRAARAALERLDDARTNAALVQAMGSADPKVRAELVRALAARRAADQVPAVLAAASDKDASVRLEALRALRTLAGAEHVPALVKMLASVSDASVRAEAEQTVVAAARKIAPPGNPAAAAIAALRTAEAPAVKASLIRVLGQIGHAGALASIYPALKDPGAEVKGAAVRALSAWPDAAPADVLLVVAQDQSAAAADRVIALRGYINMIAKLPDVTDDAILAAYARAMELATRTEEKRLVLSRLANLRHKGALKLAQQCLKDVNLAGSAGAAIRKIEKLLAAPAKVMASHGTDAVGNAIDGNASTRWSCGFPMRGGEWFRIELDGERLISGVVLDSRASAADYPRGYEVYVSRSTLGQGKLVAKGKGTNWRTEIRWAPVVGRAIRIVQTGQASGNFWSIHELEVLAKPVK